MINEEIIEKAKESVRKYYHCNGEYPCGHSGDCEICSGHNTPYDCCECGAGDFFEGYMAGVTEQKEIDIERADKWLRAHLPRVVENYPRGNGTTDMLNEDMRAEFRKAMEKEMGL